MSSHKAAPFQIDLGASAEARRRFPDEAPLPHAGQ